MRRSSLSRLVVLTSCLVAGATFFSSPAGAQRKKATPAPSSTAAPKKKKAAPAVPPPVAEAPVDAAAPVEEPAAVAPAPPPPPAPAPAKHAAQPAATVVEESTTDLGPPPQRSLRKKVAKSGHSLDTDEEADEVPVKHKKTTSAHHAHHADQDAEEEEDRAAAPKSDDAADKGDDEAAPPEKEAEAEAEPESDADTDTDSATKKGRRPKPYLLDVTAALVAFQRHFSYADDIYNELPNYDLGGAPAISLEVAVYPFKNSKGTLSAGFVGNFEYALGIATTYKVPTGDQGGAHSTTALAYGLGIRGNYSFGSTLSNIVTAGIGFGGQTFDIDHPPPVRGNANIPSVDYKFIRPNLMGRFAVIDRLAVVGTFGYLLVSSAGEIVSPDYFRGATSNASGLDVGIGAAYEIKMNPHGTVKFLELRPMLNFRRYSFKFNPAADDPYIASGATDDYIGLSLGVATRL